MNPLALSAISQPLAITPNGLVEWIGKAQSVSSIDPDAADRRETDFFGNPLPRLELKGDTAIVPISGIMIHGAGRLLELFGAISHGRISDMIDQAISSGAKRIGFKVNSPGGTVRGTPEIGAKIAGLKARGIETFAFTDSLAASAAYYAIAGVNRIYATLSASVGSVGVIAEAWDVSRMLESAGIRVNTFTSGKFKDAGNPHHPMNSDQREYLQQSVDELATDFKNFVTQYRPEIHESSMQGQVYNGKKAFSLNFVDELASDLSGIIDAQGSLAQALNNPTDLKRVWDNSASLRDEFSGNFAVFEAYQRHNQRGSNRTSLHN